MTAAPPRRKGALFAGLAIGVLAIGGGAFALLSRGGNGANTPVAGASPAVVSAPADAATATGSPTAASTTTVAVPAAPPPVVDAAAPPLDAGAAADATEPVDAAVPSAHQTKVVEHKHKPPKVGNKQGSNASPSSSQTLFDRGD